MSRPPDADPPTPPEERLLRALSRALGPDPLPDGLLGRAEGLLGYLDAAPHQPDPDHHPDLHLDHDLDHDLDHELDHELDHDLDHELAELLDRAAAEPAGSRGGAGPGTVLNFETPGGAVSVQLSPQPDRLAGQVLAGPVVEVLLEPVSGVPLSSPVDGFGRFSFPRALPGPVRLRLRRPPAPPVLTDWFVV